MSGSKELNNDRIKLSNPLKTDNIMIRAIVPTVTPASDMPEITFMALCDFLAKKYLLAMKKEKFNL
jgi:hypothetical protein